MVRVPLVVDSMGDQVTWRWRALGQFRRRSGQLVGLSKAVVRMCRAASQIPCLL